MEYHRRARRGLRNQSWKDSEPSMAFRDGSLADPPISPVEVQGYVYDAKLRVAELARDVWGDPDLAARLTEQARLLRERFNEAFWVADGYYALGLDSGKRQIDAVGSNMGHLLWSGIVPADRIDAVADRLMGDGLWSGWGVRTMSAEDRAYNPLVYHNGTVWPHDNSLIAWGLATAGRTRDAQLIAQRTFEAARYFDHRLPELMAGFDRRRSGIPVAYPTASQPSGLGRRDAGAPAAGAARARARPCRRGARGPRPRPAGLGRGPELTRRARARALVGDHGDGRGRAVPAVSVIATATSTAVDAAIPTISVSGAVATARIASAASRQRRERGTCPSASRMEDELGEQEQRRAAEREEREAERRVVAGMGDRELVADGDRDQREHDQRQRQRAPPADGAGVLGASRPPRRRSPRRARSSTTRARRVPVKPIASASSRSSSNGSSVNAVPVVSTVSPSTMMKNSRKRSMRCSPAISVCSRSTRRPRAGQPVQGPRRRRR